MRTDCNGFSSLISYEYIVKVYSQYFSHITS